MYKFWSHIIFCRVFTSSRSYTDKNGIDMIYWLQLLVITNKTKAIYSYKAIEVRYV